MQKKLVSLFLIIFMFFTILPTNVFASQSPDIFKDEVSVRVGGLVKVGMTFGTSATKAEVVISNTNIEAYIIGNVLHIKGYMEGTSWVTLNFNDGSKDSVKVIISDKYSNVSEDNEIELERGETKSIYIDLDVYDAEKATISYDSDYVSVNKTVFYSSGYLRISGQYEGESVLRIKYNTGDSEVYDVLVVDEYYNSESYEDLDVDVEDTISYYIDLDRYNADEAKITTTTNSVSLNKSIFYSSGSLKITGEYEGSSVIKVKYDTGDTEYLRVFVNSISNSDSESYVSVSRIDLEEDESQYFSVYLGDDAEEATLSVSNSNASLSTGVIYKDTKVKITGRYEGECVLKVRFDDGTRINIPVSISSQNYIEPTAELSKTLLVKGEVGVLELFMGSENTRASITVENPEKVKLDVSDYYKTRTEYTVYGSKNKTVEIKIEALDYINDTYITVKYPEGKTYKIILDVVKTRNFNTAGFDKNGVNFTLKESLIPNDNVLKMGYIAGYTDGTFGPLNNITRQEFGVILARIVDFDGDIDNSDFIYDVKADWSRESIAKLVAMGVVSKDTGYRPEDYITRYEVVEMLYNLLDLSVYSTTCPLSDVDNSLLGKKISKCWNAGILAGYEDGTFKGEKNITRAEAVVLINRIFYADTYTAKVKTFPDVSQNYWAYSHILKASKM